jgi:hypothetical protein
MRNRTAKTKITNVPNVMNSQLPSQLVADKALRRDSHWCENL